MSKYNWPDIFKTFEESNLSQARFCKEQNINPKYFNLKYSKHRGEEGSTVFTKIEIKPASASGLTLKVGPCAIQCPESMPIQSLVSLVHSLA